MRILKLIITGMLIQLCVQSTFSQVQLKSKKGEPMTLPDQGLSMNDIEKIILRPTVTGSAFGPMSKVVVYLLLKDGTIYSRPNVSPHDFDVKTSRSSNPKRWGTWSKKNNKLAIEFKTPQEWVNFYETYTTNKKETVAGIYKCVGAFYGSKVHDFNTLILQKNGRFTWRYFFRSNKKYIPHKKDKEISGNYSISNYTIQFTYDNGQKERLLFAIHKKNTGVIVGDKSFFKFNHPLLKMN
ncbi:hypothetical protein U6A24_03200 [Aquimarina gracilis]|uniref:Outer membrane lipoprotein-sorting protein n=1 Tax=Aquimarina gracilis TaxID=874422 RepID=A0ABU5ZR98_9FLAO|nr:hypothetical protein [Aquimarina gracilis]MEB3344449.1 hypothetical protein [Aquimarina gracilis]